MFVEVKRWFASREVWFNVISVLTVMATLALSQLNMLGLSPASLFYWSLALTGVVNVGNIVLRLRSTAVIGTKADVEAQPDFKGTDL